MAAGRGGSQTGRLDALLWQRSADGDDLGSLADLVRESDAVPHEPVTVETLIADSAAPLEALVAHGFTVVEMRTAGLVSLMRVPDERGAFVVSAWPTANPGVFQLIGSVPSTDSRWERVARWIGQASPHVSPCFLDHNDFSDVGTALSEHGEVEVSRLTARRRSDMSSLTRGWPQRAGTLRPNHLQAIADTDAEGASVRTLTLQVSRDDETVLSVHLRRLAGATFYLGDFPLFENLVLNRLAAAAARRSELLSGRERRLNEPLPLPISIHLPGPLLVDREATADVLAELERGTALSVAVLHRNPYLHVLATDNADGSNFDVIVVSPDAIQVYPGFRASMGAFTRLTQRLGERFEALEIAEAPPMEPVSLDDLVANA